MGVRHNISEGHCLSVSRLQYAVAIPVILSAGMPANEREDRIGRGGRMGELIRNQG